MFFGGLIHGENLGEFLREFLRKKEEKISHQNLQKIDNSTHGPTTLGVDSNQALGIEYILANQGSESIYSMLIG